MRKPTGWPAVDSVIILHDAIKGLFTKKKKLSAEEEVKKLKSELSWNTAGYAFAFLFGLKSIFYFLGSANGRGALSAAAAILTFLLIKYERGKIVKKLTALKQVR